MKKRIIKKRLKSANRFITNWRYSLRCIRDLILAGIDCFLDLLSALHPPYEWRDKEK